MTVIANRTDTWIEQLAFTGSRPSIFGPVDGVWYGHAAVIGDASGGQVHLHGLISAAKKTDWVHVLGGVTGALNTGGTAMAALINVTSGPAIESPAGASHLSMTVAGPMQLTPSLGFAAVVPPNGGAGLAGVPLFGDPHIPGNWGVIAVDFETNINTVTYRFDAWGYLIRYQSFFREVSPSVA